MPVPQVLNPNLGMGFFPPCFPTIAMRLAYTPVAGEVIYDLVLRQLFLGDGVTAGGLPLQAWPGALSPGLQFEVAGTILSTAPTTPVILLPDAMVPTGKKVYLNYILITINGGTAWTTGYNVVIQDNAAVAGITLATAQLTGNAAINSLGQTGVTPGAAVLAQSGLTVSRGIQIVGSSASIVAGSPLLVTVGGYIK